MHRVKVELTTLVSSASQVISTILSRRLNAHQKLKTKANDDELSFSVPPVVNARPIFIARSSIPENSHPRKFSFPWYDEIGTDGEKNKTPSLKPKRKPELHQKALSNERLELSLIRLLGRSRPIRRILKR